MRADGPKFDRPFKTAYTRLNRSPAVMAMGRFAAMFLAVCVTPILARALGPSDRGIAASALAVVTILPIMLGAGMPFAVRRQAAADPSGLKISLGLARAFSALTVLPAALTVPVALLWVVPGLSFPAQAALTVSLLMTPLRVSWSMDAQVLLIEGRYLAVAVLSVLEGLVSAILIIILWLASALNVGGVLWAFLAGNVFTFVAGCLLLPVRPVFDRRLMVQFREGLTYFVGDLTDVAMRRLDIVLAVSLLGAHGAGIYSVASTVGSVPQPVGQTYVNSRLATLIRSRTPFPKRLLMRCVAISAVAGVAAAALAWLFIPTVFGVAFSESVVPAISAALGSILVAWAYFCTNSMAIRNLGRQMSAVRLAGLVILLALAWPLAKALGATGLTLAVSFAYLVVALLSPVAVRSAGRKRRGQAIGASS